MVVSPTTPQCVRDLNCVLYLLTSSSYSRFTNVGCSFSRKKEDLQRGSDTAKRKAVTGFRKLIVGWATLLPAGRMCVKLPASLVDGSVKRPYSGRRSISFSLLNQLTSSQILVTEPACLLTLTQETCHHSILQQTHVEERRCQIRPAYRLF